MSTTINIHDMFDRKRLTLDLHTAAFIVYFPIGICLSVLRLFMAFHVCIVASFLPKQSLTRSFILRQMTMLLGIFVTKEGEESENAKVIISNHVTPLDRIAVNIFIQNIQLLRSNDDYSALLGWFINAVLLEETGKNKDKFVDEIRAHCLAAEFPLFIQPEEMSTNGHMGLMNFRTWPFELNVLIQPIVLKIKRCTIGYTSPSIVNGYQLVDVFWSLFVPYTHYHIKVLPAQLKNAEESSKQFAERVQQLIAYHGDLLSTKYTTKDVAEMMKRRHAPTVRRRTAAVRRPNRIVPALTRNSRSEVALKVKEVLPDVPLDIIKADLVSTGSADTTISRLLEGTVAYMPEQLPTPTPVPANSPSSLSQGCASSSAATAAISKPDATSEKESEQQVFAAKTFSKKPEERMKCFQERKEAMLKHARLKYIEKHGQYWKVSTQQ